MNIVYTDYYRAYDNKLFDTQTIIFTVNLVIDSYIPNESHKPRDIRPYTIVKTFAARGDTLYLLSMEEIKTDMKLKIIEEYEKKPEDVLEQLNVLYENDPEKIDKIINYLVHTKDDPIAWDYLRDCGIKYIIAESIDLGILCFCEEI